MIGTSQFRIAAVGTLLSWSVCSVHAQDVPSARTAEVARLTSQVNAQLAASIKKDHNLAVLQGILNEPEGSIDYAKAEVAIEKMIDPKVDEGDTLKKLDALAAAIKARFPQGDATDNETKAGILLSSLKDPGPWNDHRAFSYDFDDSLGLVPERKLLSHFLASHKGNCVSMPVLFVVLGQKLGLSVTMSTAPEHNFAKFRRSDGTWMNIEVTSYGTKSDQSYIRDLHISQRALQNGIYLQTLTQKQSVLSFANTLMQFYRHHRSPDEQMGLTTLVIMNNDKDVAAWVWRGQAFYGLQDAKYKKYGSLDNVPQAMRHDYIELDMNAQLAFSHAEQLGWVAESSEDEANYLKSIEQMKANQKGG